MRRKKTEAVSQLSRGGFCYRAAALTSDRRQSGCLREVLLADTGGHETTSRLAHELLPVELAEQHPDQACGVHTARRPGWARARRQGGRPSQVPTSARVLQRHAPQYSQVPGRRIPADVRSRQRCPVRAPCGLPPHARETCRRRYHRARDAERERGVERTWMVVARDVSAFDSIPSRSLIQVTGYRSINPGTRSYEAAEEQGRRPHHSRRAAGRPRERRARRTLRPCACRIGGPGD